MTKGERHVISGSEDDPQMASMRNVAGEVLGSMAAVKEAVAMGLTDLTIYYDYMGIRCGQPEPGSGTNRERLPIMILYSP